MRRLLATACLPLASCIVLVVQGPGTSGDGGPSQEVQLPDGGVGYRLPDGGISPTLVEAVCSREPSGGPLGTEVFFDGSESNPSPSATIINYFWSFGDGVDAGGALLSQTNHVYTAAGSYAGKLTVTDDQGYRGSASCPTVVITATPTDAGK